MSVEACDYVRESNEAMTSEQHQAVIKAGKYVVQPLFDIISVMAAGSCRSLRLHSTIRRPPEVGSMG